MTTTLILSYIHTRQQKYRVGASNTYPANITETKHANERNQLQWKHRPMNLQKQIQKARAKAGLSQSQAAKAWGVNLNTLQSWEQGIRAPKGLALKALLEIIAKIEAS